MATFSFSKSVDDIEKPSLMPEDWYIFRIVEPPKVEDNKSMKAKKTYEEGAGKNLIIKLRSISEDEEYNGRAFTLFLPFPVEEDMTSFDGRGMRKYDAKLERLANFANKATGCTAEGEEITILPGGMIGLYVTQQLDQQGQDFQNSIDWFSGFKAPDEIGQEESFDSSTEEEDSF